MYQQAKNLIVIVQCLTIVFICTLVVYKFSTVVSLHLVHFTRSLHCNGYAAAQNKFWPRCLSSRFITAWPCGYRPGPDSTFDHTNINVDDSIIAQAYDSINTITVKLPELWRSRVSGWFAQAEAQFATRGVTATLIRYYHVVQALNESLLSAFRICSLRRQSIWS